MNVFKSILFLAIVFVAGSSTLAQSTNMSKDEILKNLNDDTGSLDFMDAQMDGQQAMAYMGLNGRCQSFRADGTVDETFDLQWDESTNTVTMNETMPCHKVGNGTDLYCDADADQSQTERGVYIDIENHRLFTRISEMSKGNKATVYGVAAEGASFFDETKELLCVGFIKNVPK